NFLRKRIAVVARTRPVNRATVAPQRRPDGANARAARTLLLPELAACATHFALFFHFVCAAAKSSQIPAGSFMPKVLIHFCSADRVGQLDLPALLAFQIDDIYDRHFSSSFSKNRSDSNLLACLLRSLLCSADKNVLAIWPRHGAANQQ